MPSIIDIIAKAEEEAADIRKMGAENARDIVDGANEAAKSNTEKAREYARLTVQKRKEAAIRAGRRLTSDVFNSRAKENARVLDAALTRTDSVVNYIVERVMRGC